MQVEFNPRRVTAYRQIGYAKHQLTKEQFRDNTVDAAEIGAAESGNALYVVEVNPRGEGDLATVRVRFKVPGTSDYREHEWTVPFTPNAPPLEQASPALRLAGTASAFSEWLVASPYAAEVTPDRLLGLLNGVPATFGADPRPGKLEWMIRQAKSVSGRYGMARHSSSKLCWERNCSETLFRCGAVRTRSAGTELRRQVRSQTEFGNEEEARHAPGSALVPSAGGVPQTNFDHGHGTVPTVLQIPRCTSPSRWDAATTGRARYPDSAASSRISH